MLAGLLLGVMAFATPCPAAEDLKLRQGISFVSDVDNGFPIVAQKMEDVSVDPNMANFIFFGASGDLNTNRQAKRVVELYKQLSGKPVKFIVVDLDHPANADAVKLIKKYYHDYIPYEVIIDKTGNASWSHGGEVELNVLKDKIEHVI